jgi:copper chaperone CopZ
MKNIFLVVLLIILNASLVKAQTKAKEVKTITFAVKGNCEECKKRIENSADIKGVKFSEWNEEKQELKVIFRSDKVSEEQIKAAVAKSGHDTDTKKSTSEDYNVLPECCKYKNGDCKEKK